MCATLAPLDLRQRGGLAGPHELLERLSVGAAHHQQTSRRLHGRQRLLEHNRGDLDLRWSGRECRGDCLQRAAAGRGGFGASTRDLGILASLLSFSQRGTFS
jgi:hypothetical protein